MSDKCPWCEAGLNNALPDLITYLCGTESYIKSAPMFTCKPDGPLRKRSERCYAKQIAALQARLEAASAKLELWRAALKEEDIRVVNPAGDVIEKLQAAGEIN